MAPNHLNSLMECGNNPLHKRAPVAAVLDDVLTLEEAAALLKCHPVTAKRYAARGVIPGRKLGSMWRFSRRRLLEWIQSNESRSVCGSSEEEVA